MVEFVDFLSTIKEVGIGLGSAWIMAKTLFKMYQDKDQQLLASMNARIDDMQKHIDSCNQQNLIFTQEILSLKGKL